MLAQTRSALQPVRSARDVEPSSQGVQVGEPGAVANESESQVVQVDSPAAEENLPGSQLMHVVMLVAAILPEYFPDSQ